MFEVGYLDFFFPPEAKITLAQLFFGNNVTMTSFPVEYQECFTYDDLIEELSMEQPLGLVSHKESDLTCKQR